METAIDTYQELEVLIIKAMDYVNKFATNDIINELLAFDEQVFVGDKINTYHYIHHITDSIISKQKSLLEDVDKFDLINQIQQFFRDQQRFYHEIDELQQKLKDLRIGIFNILQENRDCNYMAEKLDLAKRLKIN